MTVVRITESTFDSALRDGESGPSLERAGRFLPSSPAESAGGTQEPDSRACIPRGTEKRRRTVMSTRHTKLSAFVTTCCLIAAISTASAAATFDFLFSTSNVRDDNQMFLNLAVSNSGYSRAVIEPVLPRVVYVEEDLPVILFVAQASHRPVPYIVDLRAQRLSWSVIFTRVGVPYDVLFVGIDRDPGPPYGNAWGYWKQRRTRYVFTDNDIRGLVRVQYGHRFIGVPQYQLARDTRPVQVVVADRRGRPFAKNGPPGHNKGHGNSQGNQGNHGDKHDN